MLFLMDGKNDIKKPLNLQRSFLIRKYNSKKKRKYYKIRFMIPFKIICIYCNFILQKGKKINAFKEEILCENYYNVKLFRFYFKCSNCLKGMIIKTDPENFSYKSELNCRKF
jgi:hypothetical protein